MNWYSRIFSPTFLWSLRFIYCIFRGHCSFTVLPPGGVGYLQKFLMWGPDRRVLGRVHCSLLTNLNEEWEHIFVQIVTWSGFDAYRWVARDNLGFIMSQVLRVRKAGFTMVCIPFALQLKDFGKQPALGFISWSCRIFCLMPWGILRQTRTGTGLFWPSPSLSQDIVFPVHSKAILENNKQGIGENWVGSRPSKELFCRSVGPS